MTTTRRILFGIVIAALVAASGTAIVSAANDDDRLSRQQITCAEEVSDLLLNEGLAALFQEFGETTPDEVEHGKQAISLIFNDLNRDMRLVGTFGPPLGGANDRPDDRFERNALRRALAAEPHTAVEKINDRWFYRRSIALRNTLHDACVQRQTNFTDEFFERTNNPGQWVGALVLRVPITSHRER